MVREFSQDLQGSYIRNKPGIYIGASLAVIFFMYLVININNSVDLENVQEFIKFYFFLIGAIVSIVILYKSLKLKLIIEKDFIEYSFGGKVERCYLTDDIKLITHEAGDITIHYTDKKINLPPFGTFHEFRLIEDFKRMGIEVIRHTSD